MAEAVLEKPKGSTQNFCEANLTQMAVGSKLDVSLNGAKGNAQLFCIERSATPDELSLSFRLFIHGVPTRELKAVCKNGKWSTSQ